MMFAALLGAMTLGACVDNEESQSVTDIRDAKTEELKSQAALNNAQAEAAKIMANAEATLKAAEAEYQKALAEQVEAQTKLLEVEAQLAAVKVEIAQANLESKLLELERQQAELLAQKAEYEQRIAQAQNTIAKNEANLDYYLAQQEWQLIQMKKNIVDATNQLESAQKIEYITLYTAYETAIGDLTQAKSDLVAKKNNLESYLAGIKSAEEIALADIESYKELIAEAEDRVAELEAKSALFEEYVTLTDAELEAKIEEKSAEYGPAFTTYELAKLAYDRYCEANPEPEMPEEIDDYVYEVNRVYNSQSSSWSNHEIHMGHEFLGLPRIYVNTDTYALGYDMPTEDPFVYEFYPIFERGDYYVYTSKYNELETGEWYYTYAPNKEWAINEANFDAYMKLWGKAVENNADTEDIKKNEEAIKKAEEDLKKLVEAYEKALKEYNGIDETIAGLKKAKEDTAAALKTAKEATVAAQKTYDAAQKAVLDAEAAEKKAADAYSAAYDKSVAVGATADDKAAAQKAYGDYLDAQADTKNAKDAFADAKKALDTATEAETKAQDAADKAAAAATPAALAKIEYDAEQALHNARSAKDSKISYIESLKNAIANSAQKFNIADYEAACEWYDELKALAAVAADEKTYEELNAYWPAHYASEEYIAYVEAIDAYYAISAEIAALEDAYAADDDYEAYVNNYAAMISIVQTDIETYEQAIAALEEAIATGADEDTVATHEAAIALAEVKVAAYQAAYDEAKAKLDAALAK